MYAFLCLADHIPSGVTGVTHLSVRVIIYQVGLIGEAPEGCSLHRHRSSAKR